MSLRITLLVFLALLTGASSAPYDQRTPPPQNYDIVIVPTEEVSGSEITKIAEVVANDTKLRIKVVLPLGTRDWKPYPDRKQYDPGALKTLALPAIERLKKDYGGKVYIVLTGRDLGPADKSLNYVFNMHYFAEKISVVSVVRMLFDEQGKQATPEVIVTRLRKILLRTIALQYFELQRSTNIEEVTYSPLMSVRDLDKMGLTIKPK
jgi:predicted Zn-dependent protease